AVAEVLVKVECVIAGKLVCEGPERGHLDGGPLHGKEPVEIAHAAVDVHVHGGSAAPAVRVPSLGEGGRPRHEQPFPTETSGDVRAVPQVPLDELARVALRRVIRLEAAK